MMIIGDMYYKRNDICKNVEVCTKDVCKNIEVCTNVFCTNLTPWWLFFGGFASGVVALLGVVGGLQRMCIGGKYKSMLLLGQMTCCLNFFQMIVLIVVGIASIKQ